MPNFRNYTFTFASGATSSNKQFIGPHSRVMLVASAMTNWNAGAGNATIEVRGGLSDSDTHALVQSATVSTMTIKGIYHMPHAILEYASVGFGTAVTGSTANTINLVVYEG